jgi:hypothetical protein
MTHGSPPQRTPPASRAVHGAPPHTVRRPSPTPSDSGDGGLRGYLARTEGAEMLARLRSRPRLVDLALIPGLLMLVAWYGYAWINHGQKQNLDYFVPLANAFLHGKLGLDQGPSWLNELIPSANGLFYVVYPPAPAIVLLAPVAIFGPTFQQEWASFFLGAASVGLVALILGRLRLERGLRVVLTLVFGFGTIVWFSAEVGSSWHFAHVVATFCLLLAIAGCAWDSPTWLIGLAYAGAVLSRLPTAMSLPFFVAYFVDRAIRAQTGDTTPFGSLRATAAELRLPPVRPFLALAIPFGVAAAVPLGMYLAYDAARFGSPLQNGYALIPGLLQESQYQHGFFSVYSLPRQLYAMLISVPQQVGDFPWIRPYKLGGLSIVFTTPLFLWSIRERSREWFTVGCWVAIALTLVPVLTHADPGGMQFGYRYAQDFYPFLFLLTVRGLRGRLSFEAWLAIVIGFAVQAWGIAIAITNGWA